MSGKEEEDKDNLASNFEKLKLSNFEEAFDQEKEAWKLIDTFDDDEFEVYENFGSFSQPKSEHNILISHKDEEEDPSNFDSRIWEKPDFVAPKPENLVKKLPEPRYYPQYSKTVHTHHKNYIYPPGLSPYPSKIPSHTFQPPSTYQMIPHSSMPQYPYPYTPPMPYHPNFYPPPAPAPVPGHPPYPAHPLEPAPVQK